MSTERPNKAERERMIHHAQQAARALEALPVLTPCTECLHYDDGYCMRWKAPVPKDARSAGCGEWDEQIPF